MTPSSYLGDNLIQQDNLSHFLKRFSAKTTRCPNPLASSCYPSAFGQVKVDEHGRVLELVENPKSPLKSRPGVYFFDHVIHDAIACIQPSARGELEITDAIQCLIDKAK